MLTGLALAAALTVIATPAAAQVPSGCSVSAIDSTVVNCTGNHATGIVLNNGSGPFRTLNVFALTADITPASGTQGIYFSSDEPGTVNVDTGPWKIVTTGNNAIGIEAGTFHSSPLTATLTGTIMTGGDFADGVLVNTISGDLALRYAGAITTQGFFSTGLRATSLDGNVGIDFAGSIATTGDSAHGIYTTTGGDIWVSAAGSISAAGADAAGIWAESATGSIFIEAAGSIAIAGDNSAGIYAQTDGVAVVMSGSNIRTWGQTTVGIFADGMSGAGVISLGSITTTGDGSAGIVVSSSSGDAIAYSAGNITTTGVGADGIFVEAMSGNAAVVNAGNISATGAGSAGIYVTAADISIVMNAGRIVGGPCCAGVMMDAGNMAVLQNFGVITAGLADYAIDMMAPSIEVLNAGTVTGDVQLSDGFAAAGTFNNLAGGLFNSGDILTAALLNNEGTIAPGGRGSTHMTFISDDFVQGPSGVYAVDLDPAASSVFDQQDSIVVSNTAELAGKVAVNFISVPLTAAQTFVILTGMGGLTDNGLGLIAGPAVNATLQFLGNELVLGYDINFVTNGLNPNERAIAANLHRIFGAGSGSVAPVLVGLLNTTDLAGYKNALDQLSPELYSDAQIAAVYGSLAFSSSLMSCKVNGADTAAIIREGQCLWAGASARFLDARTTRDQIGFTETAGLFTAGAQVALDDAWRLGFAGGYQNSTFSNAVNAQSEGSVVQGGVALKYNPGPLLLAGALSGGGGWYDTTRTMAFGGFTGIAEGDPRLGFVNGGLRAAYVVGSPQLYWKPMLDLNLTHLSPGSFTERGGNGAALAVHGTSQTVFSAAPTLEAGSEFWLSNGTLIRPLIRGGAIWYSDDDFALTAGFAGAPAGTGTFTINTGIDQVMGLIGAGLEVVNADNDTMRLTYDAQLGETTQIHSVAIRGSASF